ncbi:MAG: radical SAM protein, partial [Bacillota bacterium]
MSQLGLEASHDGVFFADKSWESLLDRSEEYRRLCLLPKHFGAPLLALWEITGRCNLRCQYCYVNAPKSGPDLSSAELRDLARQLVEQRLFS